MAPLRAPALTLPEASSALILIATALAGWDTTRVLDTLDSAAVTFFGGQSLSLKEQAPTANPPAALTEDRLLRPKQAAWYLNVKTSWIYEAVRAGRLPCDRVDRHIRFTRLMLDDWLAEQHKP
jgi:excisionase family DNA binding protein